MDAIGDREKEIDASFRRLLNGDGISRFIVLVGGLLTVFPAIDFATGMFGVTSGRTLGELAAISMIGPLIVACLFFPVRRYWYLGIVPGMIAGPLSFAALAFLMMSMERISVILVLVGVVGGSLPGYLIWYLSMRWKYRLDARAGCVVPDGH